MQSLLAPTLVIAPLQIGLGASWNAYPSSESPWVGALLLVTAIIFLGIGIRVRRREFRVHRVIGGAAGAFVFATFALSAVSVYFFFVLLSEIGGLVPSPVAVVTYGTAGITFLAISGLAWLRNGKVKAAFLSGLVAAVVGVMIFELPYLFIIAPRIGFSTGRALLSFSPLFCLVLACYTLLFLTSDAAVTRYTFFSLGILFVGFSLWAFLTNFAFPSDPVSFALNSFTKVVSFVAAYTLFVHKQGPPRNDGEGSKA